MRSSSRFVTTKAQKAIIAVMAIVALVVGVLGIQLPAQAVTVAGTASISGRVTDASGQPISGVNVSAIPTGGGGTPSTATDSNGDYSFNALENAEYSVQFGWLGDSNAATNKYAVTRFGSTTVCDDQKIDLSILHVRTGINATLQIAGSVSGIVTDASAAAVQGAYPTLTNETGCQIGYAETASDGSYTINRVPPGNHLMSVVKPSGSTFINTIYYGQTYQPYTSPRVAVVANQDTGLVNVQLAKTMIEGRVTDQNGSPVQSARVTLYQENVGASTYDPTSFGAYTDSGGYYTVTDMPVGNYKVSFSPPTGSPHFTGVYYQQKTQLSRANVVAVSEGSLNTSSSIDVTMTRNGAIAGRVTGDRGVPLQNATVVATSTTNELVTFSAITAEDGTYTMAAVAPGSYTVHFYPPDGQTYFDRYYNGKTFASADVVSIEAGNTVGGIDARLKQGGSITGTVKNKSGIPLSGINVTAIAADGSGWSVLTATDPQGKYTLNGLASRKYRVYFAPRAEDHSPFTATYYKNKNFKDATLVQVTAG